MTTGIQLQTQLAYRLGETAAPNDLSTLNQRYQWLTDGYFETSRRMNFWWQEAVDTTNSNTASTTGYSEPQDLKEFIELRIGSRPYEAISYKSAQRITRGGGIVFVQPAFRTAYKFYRFAGKYFLLPQDTGDAQVHQIRYYKRVTPISSATSTLLIPDEYSPMLAAYAEARYWMSITQQAKAQAPFQEYESAMEEMMKEQSRRGWGSSSFYIKDPSDI